MNKRRILAALLGAASAAALLAAVILAVGAVTNKPEPEDFSSEYVEWTPPPTLPPTPTPTVAPTTAPAQETPEPTETPKGPIILSRPTPELGAEWAPRTHDLEALRAKYNNNDVIGYLYIPGTSVDYPITHAGNNEYYLKHDEYRKDSSAGSLFMDYENNPNTPNYNTIIYGHNMKADTMFHAIRYYREESYYKKHKYVMLETDGRADLYEVFAFYRARVDFNYTQVVFYMEKNFVKLAGEMKALSMYDTGIDADETDVLLTLSTCTNDDADYRYVLTCVRVKDPTTVPLAELEKFYGTEAAAKLLAVE